MEGPFLSPTIIIHHSTIDAGHTAKITRLTNCSKVLYTFPGLYSSFCDNVKFVQPFEV